jgi:ribosomal protein S27E
MSGDKIWESAIPKADRNNNPWSDEQYVVLNELAERAFMAMTDNKPVRIAIESVAGSGKSSVIYGCIDIIANLELMLRTACTAFNSHIAKDAKAKLLESKKNGLNAVIFGGTNTVNAAGHSLIMKKAFAEGWSDLDLLSYGDSRYNRIARICLSSYLGWLNTGGSKNGNALLQNAQNAMELRSSSHAFNQMIGGLESAISICTDEGFVPTSSLMDYELTGTNDWNIPMASSSDTFDVDHILNTVGINQGWGENPARNLGDELVCTLVVQVLTIAVKTAFMDIQMTPYIANEPDWRKYTPLPNKNQRGWWEDCDTIDKLIRTNDPAMVKKAEFAILETAGCRFPVPTKKNGNKGSVIVNADEEYKVVLDTHNGSLTYSFVNNGHLTKFKGKGIGTQFGLKGNATVDGEKISTWRRYDSASGRALVNKGCEDKVVKLLTEIFGADKIENRTENGNFDLVESSENHPDSKVSKGVLQLTMTDQIYLPHALDLKTEETQKAQVMFIDEVQDLSVLKAELVWRFVTDDAHIVMVGDNRQAIYAFCGASSTAFKSNADRIGATFYPMTICWRGTEMVASSARVACNASIRSVKEIYGEDITIPDYDAHRSPLEAGYENWDMGSYPVCIAEHEIVDAYHKARELYGEEATFGLLSRIKKPIGQIMLALLTNGIPVSTPSEGDGNIIDSAFSLASKPRTGSIDKGNTSSTNAKAILGLGWSKKGETHRLHQGTLMTDIGRLEDAGKAKYSSMFKGDTKSMSSDKGFEEFMGNIALLRAFVGLYFSRCSDIPNSTGNVSKTISNWVQSELFSERGNNAVHIATIHRYKGDEADIMFVVDSIDNPDDEGDNPVINCFMSSRSVEASLESAIQEINMVYVGYTRAKKLNIIIKAKDLLPFKNDVSVRLEGAYDRDIDMMSSKTTSHDVEKQISSDEVKCVDCGFAHHVSNPDSIVKCEYCDNVLCKSFSGRDESGPYGCGTPASLEDMFSKSDKRICCDCADEDKHLQSPKDDTIEHKQRFSDESTKMAIHYSEYEDDYCKYVVKDDLKAIEIDSVSKVDASKRYYSTFTLDDNYILSNSGLKTDVVFDDVSMDGEFYSFGKQPFEGAERIVWRLYKVTGNRDTCLIEDVLGNILVYMKENKISYEQHHLARVKEMFGTKTEVNMYE